MRNKEVINKESGCRLGFVNDIEVDTGCGKVIAIVIYGRPRCFGILGREDDIRIRWEDISVIGPDTILVCCKPCDPYSKRKKRKFNAFDSFFR